MALFIIAVILSVIIVMCLSSPTESIHDPRLRHDCDMQYGEICYRCEEAIGDPVGEPRLCDACTRNDRIDTINS